MTTKSIKSKISQLDKKVTKMQIDSTTQSFKLTFTDNNEYYTVLELINNDYAWQSKNAALTVHVYDKLEEAANKANITNNTEGTLDLELQATIISGLYNILLNVEARGVEKARTFTKLLTNLGGQIHTAMNKLAKDNEEIQAIHIELAELEKTPTKNETSEQIKEEA